MIHCTLTDCRHNDDSTEICRKTDIIITETGCAVFSAAMPCQGNMREGAERPAKRKIRIKKQRGRQ